MARDPLRKRETHPEDLPVGKLYRKPTVRFRASVVQEPLAEQISRWFLIPDGSQYVNLSLHIGCGELFGQYGGYCREDAEPLNSSQVPLGGGWEFELR